MRSIVETRLRSAGRAPQVDEASEEAPRRHPPVHDAGPRVRVIRHVVARALDPHLLAAANILAGAPDDAAALEKLRPQFRIFRDKTASGAPVGELYQDAYHTVVVAPATSNTVAKCAFGISDTLPTNMFAQAGKLSIPGIVFACDTEPVVVTKAPHDWVTLRPRRIELENVERLRQIDHAQVVTSPSELEAALSARLHDLGLAWNTSSS